MPRVKHVLHALFELLGRIHNGFGGDAKGAVLGSGFHQRRVTGPAVAVGSGEDLGDGRGHVVLDEVLLGDGFVGGGAQRPSVGAGVGKAHGLQHRRDGIVGIGLPVQSFAPVEDDVLFGIEVA